MTPISILDLAPIPEGSDAGDALRNSLDLAQHAERLGYRRFWLAEHHSMPGIASAATAVVMAHVAASTSTIRIGSGGIMLPNHSPLIIAEQFGTLASLHPGRIDLGVGRAPGTDPAASQALRRNLTGGADSFPDDVVELMRYFRPPEPHHRVVAVPGAGLEVPVWILGSSLYGAHLAAALGLPYAFASHFAPTHLEEAVAVYRREFQPSRHLDRPYFMAALSVIAAPTDDEARFLFTSQQQAFVNLRRGIPTKLPRPVEGYLEALDPEAAMLLDRVLACAVVGSPDTVAEGLRAFAARTGADELIIAGQIHDHAARLRSYALVAGCR